MSSRIKKFLPNDTAKFTWVNTGATLDSGYLKVEDNDEAVVSSVALTSSGDGHYFGLYTTPVGSDGYYVGELGGNISGNPYTRRIRFQVKVFEVD